MAHWGAGVPTLQCRVSFRFMRILAVNMGMGYICENIITERPAPGTVAINFLKNLCRLDL